MAFPWAAALGVTGSLLSANAAKKAAQQQADAIERASMRQSATLQGLAAPYQEMTKFAFPKLRDTIMSQYGSQVGKEDPYLQATHEQNITEIGREKQKALASSNFAWGGTGNKGRARGEQLRIGRGATEATNAENVNYGVGQREFKTANTGRFVNALSAMADQGRVGTSLAADAAGVGAQGAIGAAGVRNAASQEFYGDLGSLFGMPIGDYLASRDSKRMLDAYGIGGMAGMGGGTGGGVGTVNPSALFPTVQASLGGGAEFDPYGVNTSQATATKKRRFASALQTVKAG